MHIRVGGSKIYVTKSKCISKLIGNWPIVLTLKTGLFLTEAKLLESQ